MHVLSHAAYPDVAECMFCRMLYTHVSPRVCPVSRCTHESPSACTALCCTHMCRRVYVLSHDVHVSPSVCPVSRCTHVSSSVPEMESKSMHNSPRHPNGREGYFGGVYVPCRYSHARSKLPWVVRVFVIVVSLSFQHYLTSFVC